MDRRQTAICRMGLAGGYSRPFPDGAIIEPVRSERAALALKLLESGEANEYSRPFVGAGRRLSFGSATTGKSCPVASRFGAMAVGWPAGLRLSGRIFSYR